jgi:hypothetical protein
MFGSFDSFGSANVSRRMKASRQLLSVVCRRIGPCLRRAMQAAVFWL